VATAAAAAGGRAHRRSRLRHVQRAAADRREPGRAARRTHHPPAADDRGARAQAQGKSGGAEAAVDSPLFERLRAWRAAVAKEHGVPAYVVFHDGTLRAIAAGRPSSLDELADVPGVGEKKLERYGEDLIRLVGAGG